MAIEYNTDHIAPRARFDFWRDVICDAYLPIRCDTSDPRDFDGHIALERMSQINLSTINSSPQLVRRDVREIGRDTDAYFLLSVQKSGVSEVSQSGRSCVLGTGDFALYSTSEPYEITCKDRVDQLVVQLPYEAILARVPHAELLTGMAISAQSDIGGLVSSQLQQCTRAIGHQSGILQRHMQDMIVDLVATGLSCLKQSRFDLARPEQLLLARAKDTIHTHLRDQHLDRDFVAATMGMSPRNLGRFFAREGLSVAAYIRRCRLEAITRDMTDPRMATASITEVACKWGMVNSQHFSKLFKDTYGQSPRAYRQAHRTLN